MRNGHYNLIQCCIQVVLLQGMVINPMYGHQEDKKHTRDPPECVFHAAHECGEARWLFQNGSLRHICGA